MKRMLTTAALAAALIAGGGWMLSQSRTAPGGAITLPGAANAQTTGETAEFREMTIGAEDAPIEIVEYASFTCPHCADFEENTFPKLKADYIDTGKVKFTFREAYFNKYDMWASMIARCGEPEPNRYYGIIEMIFKGQQDWARQNSEAEVADALRKIGRLAGTSEDDLGACLQDGDKLRGLLEWYQANMAADGFNSTPSLMIDGELVTNKPYDQLKTIIDEKLAAAE